LLVRQLVSGMGAPVVGEEACEDFSSMSLLIQVLSFRLGSRDARYSRACDSLASHIERPSQRNG
jgi:hypothetical protein